MGHRAASTEMAQNSGIVLPEVHLEPVPAS